DGEAGCFLIPGVVAVGPFGGRPKMAAGVHVDGAGGAFLEVEVEPAIGSAGDELRRLHRAGVVERRPAGDVGGHEVRGSVGARLDVGHADGAGRVDIDGGEDVVDARLAGAAGGIAEVALVVDLGVGGVADVDLIPARDVSVAVVVADGVGGNDGVVHFRRLD